jgi:hypothetical protein
MNDSMPVMEELSPDTGCGEPSCGASTTPIRVGMSRSKRGPRCAGAGEGRAYIF